MSDNELVDDSTYRERYTAEGIADDPVSAYYYDLGTPTADDKGWAAGVPLWEACIDLGAGIDEKDLLLAQLNVGSVGLELLGIAIDPIGSVVSSLAGWILEHIRPLREVLDMLAGNPDLIKDVAVSWANISQHLGKAQESFAAQIRQGTSEWQGEAADAYRNTADGVALLLGNGAVAADVLNKLTTAAGEAVAGVRQFLRDVIAEAVGAIASYYATRGASAGATIMRKIEKVYRVTQEALEALDEVLTAVSVAHDGVKALIESSVKAWRGYRDGSEPNSGEN